MKTVNDLPEPKRSQLINLFLGVLEVDITNMELKEFYILCDDLKKEVENHN